MHTNIHIYIYIYNPIFIYIYLFIYILIYLYLYIAIDVTIRRVGLKPKTASDALAHAAQPQPVGTPAFSSARSAPSSKRTPSSASSSGADATTLACAAATAAAGPATDPVPSAGGRSTRTSSRGCDNVSESYTEERRSCACVGDSGRQLPRSSTYRRVRVAAAARRSTEAS